MYVKRADTGCDQGARVFTIRIAVRYFAFLHYTSAICTISFVGLNLDASLLLLVVSGRRKRETIEIGDYRRTYIYILGPPSFRPTTLPVSKPIITFKHEQHTLQRYTDTRTWPNVLGTCYRRVHQHAKAHVLHLYCHYCLLARHQTCLRTLVFRVRVSLLRSVIRNVQKLR